MDITQTQSPAAAPAAASEKSRAVISSDFETFLKMLTVQMENQDPLNPIEASDYSVQLATFSGVEQQVRTNALLESLVGSFGAMGMSQLAGWVGMEARAAASAEFGGAPLTIFPKAAPAGAESAILVVRDATGNVVQRVDIAPDSGPITWAGVNEHGIPFAPGRYSFHVENFSGKTSLGTEQAEIYARITEARSQGTQTMLILAGGAEVEAGAVTALREPAA